MLRIKLIQNALLLLLLLVKKTRADITSAITTYITMSRKVSTNTVPANVVVQPESRSNKKVKNESCAAGFFIVLITF